MPTDADLIVKSFAGQTNPGDLQLSDRDKALLIKLLANSAFFPEQFKSWLFNIIPLLAPEIAISNVVGAIPISKLQGYPGDATKLLKGNATWGTVSTENLGSNVVTDAKVAAANKDGTAATPSMRTLGTGALTACAGDDARLSRTLGIDVRDYGVTGNGTSDDTSGIQNAIDDAAAVGDSVLFPPGLYMVSGLTHGVTNPIALIGRGGLNTWNGPTTIKRISGTAPVLSCLGTGANGNQRSRVTIQDLTLDGNGGGGSVLRLYRCNDVQLHRVRVRNTTGSAIWASELWNAAFSHLYVTDSGNGTTNPAVLFDDAGGAVGNSITVTMTNCEWEGNTGVELRLTSALYGCDQIQLVNGKFERGAGLGGYPFCDLAYAGDSKLIGVHFVSTDAATYNPVFIEQKGTASAYGPNTVMGCSFDSWAPAPTYFIDQTVGKLVAVGNAMKATYAAPTAFWHIGSAVGADGVTESSNYTNYPTVFQDDR